MPRAQDWILKYMLKMICKRQLLNLILDQVEYQHRFKMQDTGYSNLNPNPNPSPNLNPAPNCPFSQEQVYRVHNQQVVSYRNPAGQETRNERIAQRSLQKGCEGNYVASRLGKDQEDLGLKLLLKRVLKKDDVGSLGMIVLPKKGAEDHLPILESRRDGIVIAVKTLILRGFGTCDLGDLARVDGLQVGDFILLYKNTRSRKYMIRPIKIPAKDMKPPSRRNSKYKSQPQFGHCES